MRLKLLLSALLSASIAALSGCTSTQAVSASKEKLRDSTRKIVGTDLIGAKGQTPADQRKIDGTAARLCAPIFVWSPSECRRHDEAVK